MFNKFFVLAFLICTMANPVSGYEYELNSGWKCYQASKTSSKGEQISQPSFSISLWMPAVVPGTVLTSLLKNKEIPDPYFGLNNEKIPDLNNKGPAYYTYWFLNDFKEAEAGPDEQVWLNCRGINYSFEIYLNGSKINSLDKGMFLRHTYNITKYLAKDSNNRLAIIVYPPSPAGNANGGQGGDGMIAHSVTNQYVAGWDWIQPIHDRNTGIWDKISIQRTGLIKINKPHIVTKVPGVRNPLEHQEPAILKVSAELENPTDNGLEGYLQYTVEGHEISQIVFIPARTTKLVKLEDLQIKSPRLWWPNGYGKQDLYKLKYRFIIDRHPVPSDSGEITFGIRELSSAWNTKTLSREICVNGRKIFIKGGNWTPSDAMLQLSKERYDAQVRFHKEMNLNLIRVWGGGISERPEFYEACDKYGLLVFQEFWISGDCNGAWDDPMKLEDTSARRKYPDDHQLFIASAADQIRMLRNHPSLAIWCGGNEIKPPKDLLTALRDSLLPSLDGTRYFFPYSNDDSMSYQSGDGPYVIQDPAYFWEHKSFPFNSEIGSVGIGDYESLERIIPKEHLVIPENFSKTEKSKFDTVWNYHKYITYGKYIDAYGKPKNLQDFAKKAQLVNYEQYRSMMEGFTSHMWDWYTGFIIWKTQNPWTALLGEMYDHYLDPNACLYGLSEGAKPIHAMFDSRDSSIVLVNTTLNPIPNVTLLVRSYDINGGSTIIAAAHAPLSTSTSYKYTSLAHELKDIEKQSLQKADFVSVQLLDWHQDVIDDNLYCLHDTDGNYTRLQQMHKANLKISAKQLSDGKIEVRLDDPKDNPIAYFNRLSLVDPKTKQRILPVFYSDNYVSVLPGASKSVTLEYSPQKLKPMLCIEGWNVPKQYIPVH